MDGLWREVATVAADDQGGTFRIDRVKNRLDEILSVMLNRESNKCKERDKLDENLLLEYFDAGE